MAAGVVSQIKQESFLEDINNLLNAGEVPNLFPTDEKAEICEKMRQLDRYWQQCGDTVSFCGLKDTKGTSIVNAPRRVNAT